jgi:hypothetical protein
VGWQGEESEVQEDSKGGLLGIVLEIRYPGELDRSYEPD